MRVSVAEDPNTYKKILVVQWSTSDFGLRVIWWPDAKEWRLETRWSGTKICPSQASQIIRLMKEKQCTE